MVRCEWGSLFRLPQLSWGTSCTSIFWWVVSWDGQSQLRVGHVPESSGSVTNCTHSHSDQWILNRCGCMWMVDQTINWAASKPETYSLTDLESRSVHQGIGRTQRCLQALEENPFHASFFTSRVPGHLWAYSSHTTVSASDVHQGPSLCVSLSPPFCWGH